MISAEIESLHPFLPKKYRFIISQFIDRCFTDKTIEDGVYLLSSYDCYAKIMSYRLKNSEDCQIESHNEYIDLQYTLCGTEGISLFDSKEVCYNMNYDKQTDVQLSDQNGLIPIVTVNNTVGRFCLIYPGEPHRPMEKNTIFQDTVKKAVIKIKVSEND